MSQESAAPLWTTNPGLFDEIINQARAIFGHADRGDEVLSQVAHKFSSYSPPPVTDPRAWAGRAVRSQNKEIERQQARDDNPRGHRKLPLTQVKANNDGEARERERTELADVRLSPNLCERADELRRLAQAYLAKRINEATSLALDDCGDEHRRLYKDLLSNIMGSPQEYKDLATLRSEHGRTNINYHKDRLIAAIRKRVEQQGIDLDMLLELDSDDFYNAIDSVKIAALGSGT